MFVEGGGDERGCDKLEDTTKVVLEAYGFDVI